MDANKDPNKRHQARVLTYLTIKYLLKEGTEKKGPSTYFRGGNHIDKFFATNNIDYHVEILIET